jgi:hypothetical protein
MGKSTRMRRGRRATDVFEVFQRPKQSLVWQVLSLLVRARAELFVLAVLCTVGVWLRSHMNPDLASFVLVGALVVLVVLPWTRRFLVRRMWCVLDRHRLRACLRMSKIRTMNLDGSLPLMLWARPTKTGERVWLWIRAGSCGDDIEDALSYIAPACYAREARLHRVRQLTTVVAVEIIRRDPLSTTKPLTSPLSAWSAGGAGEGTEPVRSATVTDITSLHPVVPEPRKNTRKTTPNGAAPVPPTVVVSGEDLSDYVD